MPARVSRYLRFGSSAEKADTTMMTIPMTKVFVHCRQVCSQTRVERNSHAPAKMFRFLRAVFISMRSLCLPNSGFRMWAWAHQRCAARLATNAAAVTGVRRRRRGRLRPSIQTPFRPCTPEPCLSSVNVPGSPRRRPSLRSVLRIVSREMSQNIPESTHLRGHKHQLGPRQQDHSGPNVALKRKAALHLLPFFPRARAGDVEKPSDSGTKVVKIP